MRLGVQFVFLVSMKLLVAGLLFCLWLIELFLFYQLLCQGTVF